MAHVSSPNESPPSETRSLSIAVALMLGLLIIFTIMSPAPWLKELAGNFRPEEKVVIQQEQPAHPVGKPVTACTNPQAQSAEGPCLTR